MVDPSSPASPRIAVIAIHGVADQAASDTAHSAATLLQHTSAATYGAFERSSVRLPVNAQFPKVASGSPDLVFTAELLKGTEVPADECIYDTLRLSSVRHSASGELPREVHVFEMYWGDLSRAANSFAQMFIEFYQLAFQVAAVGRDTLRLASGAEPKNSALRISQQLRDGCDWLLTRVIPILNLCILWLALGLLPLAIPARFLPLANAAFAALSIGAIFAFLWRGAGGRQWVARALLLLAVAAIAWWRSTVSPWSSFAAGAWLCGLGGFALWKLWQPFERRRPGAKVIGLVSQVFTAMCVGWGILEVLGSKPHDQLLTLGVLRGAECLIIALHFVWVGLYLGQVLLAVSSGVAGWQGGSEPLVRRRRRALWTGELSIFGPIIVVTLLNIAFWQGLNFALPKVVPVTALQQAHYRPLAVAPGTQQVIASASAEDRGTHPGELRASYFINRHIQQSGFPLAYAGALLGLGLLATVWGLLPAILVETAPPGNASDPAASRWHGHTLTAGYWGMRIAGEIIRWAMVICTLLALLAFAGVVPKMFDPTAGAGALSPALSMIGILFLAMLLSSGFLGSLALGFRVVLDVALDVMNWLRRHPCGENTRGRIFARYIGLLRYVTEYEHRDGRHGYDAIVILAHSQGTVITADVLRFLAASPDNALPLPPIHLFTMGCPLRQLYSVRFPHLYGWVRDDVEAGDAQSRPQPSELGVTRWWNTYRSADYVGRHLWQPDEPGNAWTTSGLLIDDPVRREWCLGAGAHTHYWDEHGSEVGKALDELVMSAVVTTIGGHQSSTENQPAEKCMVYN